MNNSTRLSIALSITLPLAACGPDDGTGGGECSSTILVGDLVITEVMANPAGEDGDQEWFEIHNASSQAIDLSGLRLEYSKDDGSDLKSHRMDELVIEPGAYLVVGAMDPELKPDHVDYAFGNDLGAFLNGGAHLALRCGDSVIDEASYPDASSDDGVAFGLDGNVAPDHIANDTLDNFCGATVEFAGGQFGSPRESNEPCNIVVPGQCSEAGVMRATLPPAAGDLVISEFLADADGSDDGREWFEVYVATKVDMNGVVAGLVPGAPKVSIDSPECVVAEAGSYFLFAASDDPLLNAGIELVDQTFNFTLKNGTTSTGDGSLYVGIGETVLDQITYTEVEEATSTTLNPSLLDPASNDDVLNWCSADVIYGDGTNLGTPRADNNRCVAVCGEGQCDDVGGCRDIVPPGAGDITVTEILANPFDTGTDATQEWFEITTNAEFDLNGLEFGDDPDETPISYTIDDAECRRAMPDDIYVFAHSDVADENGNLPRVDFIIPTGFALDNSNGHLFVSSGGTVMDALPYGTARDGRARALNPNGNDICDAEDAYAGENFGSPGEANPVSTTQCDPL
jgi:hypothetical protein